MPAAALLPRLSAAAAAAGGLFCPNPTPARWPGHAVENASAYRPPAGRRVLTVLASASGDALELYGAAVAPLFRALDPGSGVSLLGGGCCGLMGAGARLSSFCAGGELGGACSVWAGFWRGDIGAPASDACLRTCEERHHVRVHLLADPAAEELILTGGASSGVGDAFLLLPGGVGTRREFFDVLEGNLELGVNKPVFCLNTPDLGPARAAPPAGFYDRLLYGDLRQLFDDGLAYPYDGSRGTSLYVSGDAAALAAAINRWAASGELPRDIEFERLINHTSTVAA